MSHNYVYVGYGDLRYFTVPQGGKELGKGRVVQINGRAIGVAYNPRAVLYQGRVYIVYQGKDDPSGYLRLIVHGRVFSDKGSYIDQWHGPFKIAEMAGNAIAQSDGCPSLAVLGGALVTVYKKRNSKKLMLASFDGARWEEEEVELVGSREPVKAAKAPGIAVYNHQLHIVFVKEQAGSKYGKLYMATHNSSGWTSHSLESIGRGSDYEAFPSQAISCFVAGGKLFANISFPVKGKSSFPSYCSYDGAKWSAVKAYEGAGGWVCSDFNGASYGSRGGFFASSVFTSRVGEISEWFTIKSLMRHDGKHFAECRYGGGGYDHIFAEQYLHGDHHGAAKAPLGRRERSRWMNSLRGDLLLSEVNLPGSHDSAAIRDWMKPYKQTHVCQNHSITDQLIGGVRVLDVRLQVKFSEKKGVFFMTCHGDLLWSTFQSFDSLLKECRGFLVKNKRETIVMSLKIDEWKDGDSADFKRKTFSVLADLLDEEVFVKPKAVPNLSQVRGKIVVFNRINHSLRLGAPMHWNDNTSGQMIDEPGLEYSIYVQDQYKGLPGMHPSKEKFDLVSKAFDKGKGVVVWNFGSATWFGLFGVDIHSTMLEAIGRKKCRNRPKKLGWVLFDHSLEQHALSLVHEKKSGSAFKDNYFYRSITDLVIASNFMYGMSKGDDVGFEKEFTTEVHSGFGDL
ncbi:MAG: phosphatidylinositol-specific phospholipase C domain-containing protein [Acidobacteriota bacterium]